MPRGFGRGAKTVGIVTHAQAKTKGKKTPRGLRGVRQKKRARFQQNKNEDRLLEKSLGLGSEPPKGSGSKSLTEDIASIYVPHVINKRQKGLKTLRKQILGSVKEIYRARANSKKKNSKNTIIKKKIAGSASKDSMRKVIYSFIKARKCTCLVRGLSSKATVSDGAKNDRSTAFSEDPVQMLQEMQKKMRQHSQTGSKDRTRKGAAKKLFFQKETHQKKNVFVEKLISMESSLDSASSSTPMSLRENRKKKKAEEIKKERSKLLVFRDVGMSLDKPILSRDVFLLWKYFRLGRQFAIDNELERMLRYFNEHAVNELKIIDNGKLMRGPETLFKFHDLTTSNRFQSLGASLGHLKSLSLKFPTLHCYNAAPFCSNPSSDVVEKISQLLFRSESSFRPFISRRTTEYEDPIKFSPSLPKTSISSNFFVRPAVVIFSQLGQKFGAAADEAWRKLAFSSISPSIVSPTDTGYSSPTKSCSLTRQHSLSIDVVSLRSSDLYSYKWVQKLIISRFLSSLSKEEDFNSHLLAATTFVGSKLLHPFFDVVGLRNYLSPYVFLVDGLGNIRWMSSGLPDSVETSAFPSLLLQLAAGH